MEHLTEHFVFQHKGHVFNVTQNGYDNSVEIRQSQGHHIWTVHVVAPLGTSRWDLGNAALKALLEQRDEIDIT